MSGSAFLANEHQFPAVKNAPSARGQRPRTQLVTNCVRGRCPRAGRAIVNNRKCTCLSRTSPLDTVGYKRVPGAVLEWCVHFLSSGSARFSQGQRPWTQLGSKCFRGRCPRAGSAFLKYWKCMPRSRTATPDTVGYQLCPWALPSSAA